MVDSTLSAPPAGPQRPRLVTLFAVLHLLGGTVLALPGGILLLARIREPAGTPDPIGAFLFLWGSFHLVAGFGLLKLQSWGRNAAIVLAVVELLVVPFGTMLSALALYYLHRPGIRALFSGRTRSEWTADETRDRAAGSSRWLVAAVGLTALGLPVFLLILTLPFFLKGSTGSNEAMAIGDLRTLATAQTAYKAASGGTYGPVECLIQPGATRCISGHSGPPFVEAGLVATQKDGYQRTFTLNPDRTGYTFSAVPTREGWTGHRSFCVSETGVFCFTHASVSPLNAEGRCDYAGRCSYVIQ